MSFNPFYNKRDVAIIKDCCNNKTFIIATSRYIYVIFFIKYNMNQHFFNIYLFGDKFFYYIFELNYNYCIASLFYD